MSDRWYKSIAVKKTASAASSLYPNSRPRMMATSNSQEHSARWLASGGASVPDDDPFFEQHQNVDRSGQLLA